MNRTWALLSAVLLGTYLCAGQNTLCTIRLQGRVDDIRTHEPLELAGVRMAQSESGTFTDEQGLFTLSGLCAGPVTLIISHLGCEDFQTTIELKRDTFLHIDLNHHDVEMHEVIVQEHQREETVTQAVTKLSQQELFMQAGLPMAQQLEKIEGVSTLNTGGNVSKPVIHGLHSQRVVVMNNGVKLESQQWGSEHAPEADPFLCTEMSVVKGAAGLRYGSDAIGGVVLLQPAKLPYYKNQCSALVQQTFFSANRQVGAAALVQGSFVKTPAWAWRVHAGYQRGGNLRTPAYWMKNTGLQQINFSIATGLSYEKWSAEVFYTYFTTSLGVFSAAHIGNLSDLQQAIASPVPLELSGFTYQINRPRQTVNHHLLKAVATVQTGTKGKLQLQFSWQQNLRSEYDKHLPLNNALAEKNLPGFEFRIQTVAVDLLWQHRSWKNLEGSIGLSSSTQTNEYQYGYFIPAFWNFGGGLFAIERLTKGRWEVEAGLRMDYKWMQAFLPEKLGGSSPVLQFANPSGSVGFEYHFQQRTTVSVNAGSAWRAPHVSELYADGVHHGAATYEKGSANLKAENAFNFSSSFQHEGKWWQMQSTLYSNYLLHFIYARPVQPATLTIRGAFPTFQFTQTNALLSGLDLRLSFTPFSGFAATSRAELLLARNMDAKQWLEQMPPQQFSNSLRYTTPAWHFFRTTYFEVEVQNVLRQTLVPASTDYAPAPPAYWLLHFSLGGTLQFGHQQLEWGVTIQNLLNKRYRSYQNRLRYFSDEKGTDVQIRVQIPIGN